MSEEATVSASGSGPSGSGPWSKKPIKQKLGTGEKKKVTAQVRAQERKIPGILRSKQQLFEPAVPLRQTEGRPTSGSVSANGFSSDQYLYGNWTRPDMDEDERMLAKLQLVDPTSGRTPLGSAQLEDRDIQYFRAKKAAMENVKKQELASMLINDKDPSSQQKVWETFPTLFSVPEEQFMNQLQLGLQLRVLLRDGTLGGEEDLDTLMYLLRDDAVLPVGPIWDPTGAILKDEGVSEAFTAWISARNASQHGFLNPLLWDGQWEDKDMPLQRVLKAVLLKRIFPAFRDMAIGDIKKWIVNFNSEGAGNELIPARAFDINRNYKLNKFGPSALDRITAALRGGIVKTEK
jgi:hypothetical protein